MRAIPGAEARATAAETFRRLYWDTAASWSDPAAGQPAIQDSDPHTMT
jgi:hypothetical protein